MMDLNRRLSKAKTALILEHPFVGAIAMNMPFTLSDMVPTAGTNGKRVLFNPDFIEPLTDEELTALVAHECFHPMLEHCWRRYEREPRKWNMACDYVINELIVLESIGKLPAGGLKDTAIYNAGGGTSDGIYNKLPDSPPNGGGFGPGSGTGWQDLEDGDGTQAEQDQAAAEMKVRVAQAAQAAKMMGKMSANMARLVDEVLNPKVDWREVLQRFVEKCRDDTRSWARPNRRYIAQGMYLPSPDGEAMGELVFAIDCSGSINRDTLNQFSAEVTTVHEDQRPTRIHLVYFDSDVCHYESFGREDDLHIEMHGGGGTAFSPVFRYIQDHDIEPVACVFLTDLCCNDFGPQPEYPVLWVSTDEGEAPFGEIVLM